MKKVLVTILAVLYITIASGVVINVHYCMGRLASVNYGYKHADDCGKCGMKSKKGCCQTENKLVKLQDAHHMAKIDMKIILPSVPLSNPISFVPEYIIDTDRLPLQNHSPPEARNTPIHIQHCVFRI